MVVIEKNKKKYLIPIDEREFNGLKANLSKDTKIEVVFITPEEFIELDNGSSLSSVAMYKARWKLLKGEILEKEEKHWSWEAGSAGGSGVKGRYKFSEGSIIWEWIYRDYTKPYEVARLIVVGKPEDYEMK